MYRAIDNGWHDRSDRNYVVSTARCYSQRDLTPPYAGVSLFGRNHKFPESTRTENEEFRGNNLAQTRLHKVVIKEKRTFRLDELYSSGNHQGFFFFLDR